ncbi:hypothetical protein GOODEAATRI_024917, partial [Goodea atripinnis]
ISTLHLQAGAVITDVSLEAAALHDTTLTHSMWAVQAVVGFPGSVKRNCTKPGFLSGVNLPESTIFFF